MQSKSKRPGTGSKMISNQMAGCQVLVPAARCREHIWLLTQAGSGPLSILMHAERCNPITGEQKGLPLLGQWIARACEWKCIRYNVEKTDSQQCALMRQAIIVEFYHRICCVSSIGSFLWIEGQRGTLDDNNIGYLTLHANCITKAQTNSTVNNSFSQSQNKYIRFSYCTL